MKRSVAQVRSKGPNSEKRHSRRNEKRTEQRAEQRHIRVLKTIRRSANAPKNAYEDCKDATERPPDAKQTHADVEATPVASLEDCHREIGDLLICVTACGPILLHPDPDGLALGG
jgi:hypothetical protein